MIAASIYVKYLNGKKKSFLFFRLYSFPDNTMFFPFTTHLNFMSLQPVHFYQDRSRIVLGLVKTHTQPMTPTGSFSLVLFITKKAGCCRWTARRWLDVSIKGGNGSSRTTQLGTFGVIPATMMCNLGCWGLGLHLQRAVKATRTVLWKMFSWG